MSIHDVNEACSLIRQATANEDVQMPFGVVLNEAMGDEVKMTVIATGFEREGLSIPQRPNSYTVRSAPPPPVVVTTNSMTNGFYAAASPEPAIEPHVDEAEPLPWETEPEPAHSEHVMEAAHHEPEPEPPPVQERMHQAAQFSVPRSPIPYQAPLTPDRPAYQPPSRTLQTPAPQQPHQQQARAAAANASPGMPQQQPHHPPPDDPFAPSDLETPAFLRRVRNRMFQ